MVCKACGTEIAEKALICYKCGAATFEAVRKPVPLPPSGARPWGWMGVVALAAVTLAGLGPVGGDLLPASVAYGGAIILAGVCVWSVVRPR